MAGQGQVSPLQNPLFQEPPAIEANTTSDIPSTQTNSSILRKAVPSSPKSPRNSQDELQNTRLLSTPVSEGKRPADGEVGLRTNTPSRPRDLANTINNWWIMEFGLWTVSCASLAALVLVLWYHDGQPLPRWPFSITLNSLFSTFTTICKATLMVPVAQSLGQLKWTWFAKRTRNLEDFESLDSASRGTWGSLKLLIWQRGRQHRHLACIGAIITLLALPTSPITQQAVSYPLHFVNVSDSIASVPQSQSFLNTVFDPQASGKGNAGDVGVGFDYKDDSHVPLLDSSTIGAFYSGLYTSASQTAPHVAPICPTGNCTFPLYNSLGVCVQVANASDGMIYGCDTGGQCGQPSYCPAECRSTLSNGLSTMFDTILSIAPVDVRDANGSPLQGGSNQTINFKSIQYPIADIFFSYTDGSSLNGTGHSAAYEAIFYWCIKQFSTDVQGGISTTNSTRSFTNITRIIHDRDDSGLGWTPLDTPSPPSTLVLQAPGDSTVYQVSSSVTWAMTNFTEATLVGELTYFSPVTARYYTTDASSRFAPTDANPLGNMTAISAIVNNIATSLTNNIRTQAGSGNFTLGTVQRLDSYIQIRWAWLSLLFVLEILSLVFLIITVCNSRMTDTGIWKTSSLPVLQALDDDSRKALGPLSNLSDATREAKMINATLERDENGWKLDKR
ncbi:uncharacterized protein PAC_16653 [Phialocephala subalpina]|uniref:Uncharacterized protein n=1 Tax=Phialocephala subalpina TaxID=576137 RepID=A0A1L7XP04_9HELO|nr:uncharacterized protein PAC_16653 [Phialocephala subalpina]